MQEILSQCPLFRGLTPADLEAVLTCLAPRPTAYPKGAAILRAGEPVRRLGVVLSGSVQVCRESADGGRLLLAAIGPAGIFAEAYACAGPVPLSVSVWAGEECRVLFLDAARITATCAAPCPHHARLLSNLVSVLAQKNLFLSRRMDHLSRRTLADKLLSYLEEQRTLAGTDTFTIPLDRQALADYLCADRSALSREIGRLQKAGALKAQKNRFTLFP